LAVALEQLRAARAWDDGREAELDAELRAEIDEALSQAEAAAEPEPETLTRYVYAEARIGGPEPDDRPRAAA
jgi:TPP-dependent pyruvate/acetoin dehydrogenase alpha subunit